MNDGFGRLDTTVTFGGLAARHPLFGWFLTFAPLGVRLRWRGVIIIVLHGYTLNRITTTYSLMPSNSVIFSYIFSYIIVCL